MTDFIMHPEQPLESGLAITDDVFVKWYKVPRSGTILPQHSHVFSHVSVIAHGGVRCWQDGELKGDFMAPTTVKIEARSKHTFLTLADDTVFLCVHNISRTGEIEIEEEHHLVNDL